MNKKSELIDHNLSRKKWNMPSEFDSYIWIAPKKQKTKKLKLYCEMSLIYVCHPIKIQHIYYLSNFRENLFEYTQYNETKLKMRKLLKSQYFK